MVSALAQTAATVASTATYYGKEDYDYTAVWDTEFLDVYDELDTNDDNVIDREEAREGWNELEGTEHLDFDEVFDDIDWNGDDTLDHWDVNWMYNDYLNEDGVFHPSQVYFDEFIEEADRDGDGMVSGTELELLMGPSCWPDADEIMEWYDWDGDGKLDEDQARWMCYDSYEGWGAFNCDSKWIEYEFNYADSDLDGVLTYDEFMSSWYGDELAWSYYTMGDDVMEYWMWEWMGHDYNNGWGLWDPEPWYDERWPEFSEPWEQYSSEHSDYGEYDVLYADAAASWFGLSTEDMLDGFMYHYGSWTDGVYLDKWDAQWAFNDWWYGRGWFEHMGEFVPWTTDDDRFQQHFFYSDWWNTDDHLCIEEVPGFLEEWDNYEVIEGVMEYYGNGVELDREGACQAWNDKHMGMGLWGDAPEGEVEELHDSIVHSADTIVELVNSLGAI